MKSVYAMCARRKEKERESGMSTSGKYNEGELKSPTKVKNSFNVRASERDKERMKIQECYSSAKLVYRHEHFTLAVLPFQVH